MFKRKFSELSTIKKNHPVFFFCAAFIIFLYGLQFVLKVEITPLGYFSLYSDPAYTQKSYPQILPVCMKGRESKHSLGLKADFDSIYEVKGAGFLMLEILPTRYDILRKSDHCNQMNHKLQRLGLHDENSRDCEALGEFEKWFSTYKRRLGINSGPCMLMDVGFKNGKIIDYKFLFNAP
jgi:hypothetical protein